jgi:hypothetical protein
MNSWRLGGCLAFTEQGRAAASNFTPARTRRSLARATILSLALEVPCSLFCTMSEPRVEQAPVRKKAAASTTEDAALAMGDANEQLWVLKVPKFLNNYFSVQHAAGRPLGTIAPSSSSAGASSSSSASTAYTLTLDGATLPEGIPCDYEVNFGLAPPATYIFSHSAAEPPKRSSSSTAPAASASACTGGAAAGARLEGRVVAKGEIRPKGLDEDYHSLVRERFEKAQEKKQIDIVGDDEVLKKPALNHHGTQREEKRAKEERGEQRALASSKRQRHVSLSRTELREKVLDLFGQKAYWAKIDLEYAIGTKDGLKVCLDEVCVKVTKRGENYGDYELKPELSGRATSKARADL